MTSMRKALFFGLAMAIASPMVMADTDEKQQKKAAENAEKRQAIDKVAQETLDELFAESESAKKLYDKAYGHAVFSNFKFQFIIAGGGGQGVAVAGGKRTYMKMGTAGVGLGIGGKKQSIIFLFENEKSFRSFVDKGWQADAQAGAAAGTAAAEAETTFKNGVAYYQITKKGLIASADISGTKYWKGDELNDR